MGIFLFVHTFSGDFFRSKTTAKHFDFDNRTNLTITLTHNNKRSTENITSTAHHIHAYNYYIEPFEKLINDCTQKTHHTFVQIDFALQWLTLIDNLSELDKTSINREKWNFINTTEKNRTPPSVSVVFIYFSMHVEHF